MTKNVYSDRIFITEAASLCFDKNEFNKDSFNLDEFIVNARRYSTLENLRNDLHLYLKILQNAMIELINKDYADFLNLSTNLVGMDKSINHLIQPLKSLRQEIHVLNVCSKEKFKLIEEKLNAKKQVKTKKDHLKILILMMKIKRTFDESLILNDEIKNKSFQMENLNLLEKNQIDFYSKKLSSNSLLSIQRISEDYKLLLDVCSISYPFFREEYQKEGKIILEQLKPHLADSFKHCLMTNKNQEELKSILWCYSNFKITHLAEQHMREGVVRSFLQKVITEKNLEEAGLDQILEDILKFILLDCSFLKDATSGPNSVIDFDFLVNSVFPEIISSLEARLNIIFAPGNPNLFHQSYESCFKFLKNFELLLWSQASIKRFRSSPSFQLFQTKWAFSIYFQIRFQEIAGQLEKCLLEKPYAKFSKDFDLGRKLNTLHFPLAERYILKLQCSYTLVHCLMSCWNGSVFLPPLTHRFWKLSLQLISRYLKWLNILSNQIKSYIDSFPSVISSSITRVDSFSTFSRISSQEFFSDNDSLSSSVSFSKENFSDKRTQNFEISDKNVNLENCIFLLSDVRKLKHLLLDVFNDEVKNKFEKLTQEDQEILKDSWMEQISYLDSPIFFLLQFISSKLSASCLSHFEAVYNIPRIYKRTNREPPSKHSSYVDNIFIPIEEFLKNVTELFQPQDLSLILNKTFSLLTEIYYNIVTKVLTSVKRMEESLKKLQSVTRQNETSLLINTDRRMEDDDKIQSQLSLDIQEFDKKICQISIDESNFDYLKKLKKIASMNFRID